MKNIQDDLLMMRSSVQHQRRFHQSALSLVYRCHPIRDLCNAISITNSCMEVVQFALRREDEWW